MSAYPREAEPEGLALTSSMAASHISPPPDVEPEAMAAGSVAKAAPKANLPVLDLLHWSDSPNPNPGRSTRFSATNDSSAFMNASDERSFQHIPVRSEVRTSQPAGGVSTISFGGQLTPQESEQLQRRRPGSDSKRREMLGSGIFDQDVAPEPVPDVPARKVLAAGRANPKSASTEDTALSPKRPNSLSEVAKQRELTGTFFGNTHDRSNVRRPCSSAKTKELEGSNIFGTTNGDLSPECLANDFNKLSASTDQENSVLPRTSVKVSNPAGGRSQISFGCDGELPFGTPTNNRQGHNQKAAELLGNNIFKEEGKNNASFHGVSAAKKREMLGNDIFSDMVRPDPPRRTRQPPGGESNLRLY